MIAQEFLRHCLRWISIRCLQEIKSGDGGPYETIFPPTPCEIEVKARPRFTRQGAFEEWTTHLPHYYFRANMASDTLVDSPVFRHDMKREFHLRFADSLRQMRRYPTEIIPQYAHAHDVPLNLFGQLHLNLYTG